MPRFKVKIIEAFNNDDLAQELATLWEQGYQLVYIESKEIAPAKFEQKTGRLLVYPTFYTFAIMRLRVYKEDDYPGFTKINLADGIGITKEQINKRIEELTEEADDE